MKAQELLFAMLRSVICGEKPDENIINAATPELVGEAFDLANRHDLGHLVGQAASDWKLPESEAVTAAKHTAMQALYRHLQMDRVNHLLCKTLEEGEIPFIPLKGAVLRYYYPQPWMRTSCDIDVLVPVERLEEAACLLVDRLQYRRGGKGDHDISMYAPEGVHIELHYSAVDEGRFPESQKLLSQIWNSVYLAEGSRFHHLLHDEMFYFYHIAHMAKHFENGGCGIRPFLDLWILNHKVDYDSKARQNLCQQGGMGDFDRAANALTEAWLGHGKEDEMGSLFAQYTLTGGVYGTLDSQVAVRRSKQGGAAGFVLSKAFPPYITMKYTYPVLQKRKWLLPVYYVVRWFHLLFRGGVKRSVRQLQMNAEAGGQAQQTMNALLQYLGLDN